MHKIGTVANEAVAASEHEIERKWFYSALRRAGYGAEARGIFSAMLASAHTCRGRRPSVCPSKGAFHLQPRNGDTDRSPQPRYMRVRQDRASDPLNTRDVTKTARPACAKSHASRNASRRRVKFCRRRLPRDGGDRLALGLIGRMPSTRNSLAGLVASIGHGGKGRRYDQRKTNGARVAPRRNK